MKDYPVQLPGKAGVAFFSIVPHPVNADIYFGLNRTPLRKIKSYYIGIKVMLKKLPVDIKKPFIRAKDIVDGT